VTPFREKIAALNQSIQAAALKVKSDPSSIMLLPVTKTVEPARILQAYETGIRCFGENRVQELVEKMDKLPRDIEWHMIGRLQTNKVKYIVGRVALIQSLDRLDLFKEIERQALKKGVQEAPCLLEINSSGEPQKGGLMPEAVDDFLKALPAESPIRLKGLMTVGPPGEDKEKVRSCFRAVRSLQAKLKEKYPRHQWDILSMGMSGDYEIAIEEGSTLIRLGSLLFGSRPI